MECGKCYQRKRKIGVSPLCETEAGCPIESIAKSTRIKDLILGFMQYKRMNLGKMPEFLQLQQLKDSGIMEIGYDFLISLESVYNSYIENERAQQEKKAELEKIKEQAKKRR